MRQRLYSYRTRVGGWEYYMSTPERKVDPLALSSPCVLASPTSGRWVAYVLASPLGLPSGSSHLCFALGVPCPPVCSRCSRLSLAPVDWPPWFDTRIFDLCFVFVPVLPPVLFPPCPPVFWAYFCMIFWSFVSFFGRFPKGPPFEHSDFPL